MAVTVRVEVVGVKLLLLVEVGRGTLKGEAVVADETVVVDDGNALVVELGDVLKEVLQIEPKQLRKVLYERPNSSLTSKKYGLIALLWSSRQ